MKTITYDELRQIIVANNDDVTIINVLPADAYQKNHIPGSINISVQDDDFVQQVEQRIGGKDKAVIVYCASYSCNASRNAAEKLEQAGFTNVRAYEGGMQEWQEKSSRQAA